MTTVTLRGSQLGRVLGGYDLSQMHHTLHIFHVLPIFLHTKRVTCEACMHGGRAKSRLVLALAAPVSGYSFLNSNEVTETEARHGGGS